MASPTPSGTAATWTRRGVLGLGLGLGTAACSLDDPALRGRASPTSPPGTSSAGPARPSGAAGRAAAAELRLAGLAEAVRGGSPRPDAAHRAVLRLVVATHAERAAALSGPDPASRAGTTSGNPSPSGGPAASTVAALVRAERLAARGYRSSALATSGGSALLWGSMAVASERFAQALTDDDPPRASTPRAHRPTALVPDTEAVREVVGALHAVVYGYQLALGRLTPGTAAHRRATGGLAERRVLLDELSDALAEAGLEVPAARPAYVPSTRPRDPRTAGRLIRQLESALLPFCGLWLAAAAQAADRRRALDALASTAAAAESWGAALQAWPGWRD